MVQRYQLVPEALVALARVLQAPTVSTLHPEFQRSSPPRF